MCRRLCEIPTCCANFGMDFVGVRLRFAHISSNVSFVKTVRLRSRFFFATEPVLSNFFTISCVVNLEGGTSPGNVWMYSVRTRLGRMPCVLLAFKWRTLYFVVNILPVKKQEKNQVEDNTDRSPVCLSFEYAPVSVFVYCAHYCFRRLCQAQQWSL